MFQSKLLKIIAIIADRLAGKKNILKPIDLLTYETKIVLNNGNSVTTYPEVYTVEDAEKLMHPYHNDQCLSYDAELNGEFSVIDHYINGEYSKSYYFYNYHQMHQLLKILKVAEKKPDYFCQYKVFKEFMDAGDTHAAWRTVLGNWPWLYRNCREFITRKEIELIANGVGEQWHENGRMWIRERYKNGKLDGVIEHWHRNGHPAKRGRYKNGKLEGLQKQWDAKGQLSNIQRYKNGKFEGLQETWCNGQNCWRCNYKNGKLDGTLEGWYCSGHGGPIWQRINYKNGELDGICERWFENGQLYNREYYNNGKLVSWDNL